MGHSDLTSGMIFKKEWIPASAGMTDFFAGGLINCEITLERISKLGMRVKVAEGPVFLTEDIVTYFEVLGYRA